MAASYEADWLGRIGSWRADDAAALRASSAIVLLGGNATFLGTLVAAWPSLALGQHLPQQPPPSSDHDAWSLLWATPGEDAVVSRIVDATGLPAGEARACFRIAMINRLIYPDGSLSTGAKAWLAGQARAIVRPVRRGGNEGAA